MKGISEINKTHEEAMNLAELALIERIKGKSGKSVELFKKAYFLEKEAALAVPTGPESEPSRSILLRSAASLAMNCRLFPEAKELIEMGLAGEPPAEIAGELHELYRQIEKQMNESSVVSSQKYSSRVFVYKRLWGITRKESASVSIGIVPV